MSEADPPLLEVRDLSWTAPDGDEPIFRGVDFQLGAGDLVVLEGPSGAGKSTLLRCVIGLEDGRSGTVLWRGEEVGAHNIRPFRNRVVYVHQSPEPIAPRIGDNLDFPRRIQVDFPDYADAVMGEDEQRRLLARFHLEDLDFSRRFDELSLGEKQRLALVRCLSVRPEVLLLDEPTASLDETNARRVEDYVTEYVEEGSDRAAIWIGHDAEQRRRLGGRRLDMEREGWLGGGG